MPTPVRIYAALHPLISWVQAGNWYEISDSFVPAYGAELLPLPGEMQPGILRAQGSREQHGTQIP
jgi:hypothetical protein